MNRFDKSSQLKATIRLTHTCTLEESANSIDFIECIKHGFVFMNKNVVLSSVPQIMFNAAVETVGTDVCRNNSTFHKSFNTVANAEFTTLLMTQIEHYCSTYGREMFGLEAVPYIPTEILDIPEGTPSQLTIIYIESASAVMEKVKKVFFTVKQPDALLLRDLNDLVNWVHWEDDDVDNMQSFELKVCLCNALNIVPKQPIDFLRLMVYKATGNTLLIKNKSTIQTIKYHCRYDYTTFKDAFAQADLTALATIFFRYKELFLAFKSANGCGTYINKIRRLADVYHKPLSKVCVQNFITLAIEDDFDSVCQILNKCDIFELVKLLNICIESYERNDSTPRAFNIRNGSTFVSMENKIYTHKEKQNISRAIGMIQNALTNKVDLSGKTFYIPEHINYAMPTSSKQFVGNIPWGSILTLPADKAFTVGISWENYYPPKGIEERVDLDLHMHGSNGECYGWNGYFRGGKKQSDIIFSGDMTDARNGAAEAFYFKPDKDTEYVLDISKFAGPHAMDYKLFINGIPVDAKKENYVYNPANDLIPAIPMLIDGRTENIGFVSNNKFYFYGGSLSQSICGNSEYYPLYLKAMLGKMKTSLSLSTILMFLGAVVTDNVNDIDDNTISLAPENLTPTTIIDIFK